MKNAFCIAKISQNFAQKLRFLSLTIMTRSVLLVQNFIINSFRSGLVLEGVGLGVYSTTDCDT